MREPLWIVSGVPIGCAAASQADADRRETGLGQNRRANPRCARGSPRRPRRRRAHDPRPAQCRGRAADDRGGDSEIGADADHEPLGHRHPASSRHRRAPRQVSLRRAGRHWAISASAGRARRRRGARPRSAQRRPATPTALPPPARPRCGAAAAPRDRDCPAGRPSFALGCRVRRSELGQNCKPVRSPRLRPLDTGVRGRWQHREAFQTLGTREKVGRLSGAASLNREGPMRRPVRRRLRAGHDDEEHASRCRRRRDDEGERGRAAVEGADRRIEIHDLDDAEIIDRRRPRW